MNFIVDEEKPIYIVWTNTDLTEGRGGTRPIAYCVTLTTAKRLAKGKYVQGTDCPITEEIAVRNNGYWYSKVHLAHPTKEDKELDKKLQENKEILEKLKQSGLTLEDIKKIL